jgi:hypothetical protein
MTAALFENASGSKKLDTVNGGKLVKMYVRVPSSIDAKESH